MTVFDLQTIRYINLLDSTSRVKTRKCFVYNNTIFFAVPKNMVSKAIGPNAENVKRIHEKLGKRIKVIPEAVGIEDARRFIEDIVSPVQFNQFDIQENNIIITAGAQNKAALIGRNRRRETELKQILHDTFGYELRIL
jgi:NusA-like KH domain protein